MAPAAASTAERGPPEVSWESLDKRRFLLNSVVILGGVSTVLYPLTVLKTRQMALADDSLLSGLRKLARAEGLRGLVRAVPRACGMQRHLARCH
jgi:hypothetical protein